MITALTRRLRRRPTTPATVVADAQSTLLPIDAPASLPLPFTTIPEPAHLIADATHRADTLSASGGADEFCGHVFDTHYDRWEHEARHSAAYLAGEQRRVDRVLIDNAHHTATTAHARAHAAQRRAHHHTHTAETLWNTHFPHADHPTGTTGNEPSTTRNTATTQQQ